VFEGAGFLCSKEQVLCVLHHMDLKLKRPHGESQAR
jgi:hypothetical protein